MTSSAVAAPVAPAGALLGLTVYDPTSQADYTTTSATSADIDATNMAVSFIVPASGKVLVRLTALSVNSSNADYNYWSLREGAVDIAGPIKVHASQSSTLVGSWSKTFIVSGLTPGAAKTYKWGHKTGAGTMHTYAGGTLGTTSTGAAIMEVYDAAIAPSTLSIVTAPRELARVTGPTTAQTGISTVTDINQLIATFTVATYPVDVILEPPFMWCSTGNVNGEISLTDNSNVVKRQMPMATSGAGVYSPGQSIIERITTPGTYTRKARTFRDTGTGTINVAIAGAEATTYGILRVVEVAT